MYQKTVSHVQQELKRYHKFLQQTPSLILVFFVLGIVCMNLLANKSIIFPGLPWLVSDCGLIASWLVFLSLDVLVKLYGPEHATRITIIAVIINLIVCVIFFISGSVPGYWGESYIETGGEIANTALNNTFKGSWFVLFGSTCATIISSFVNNFGNHFIGIFIKDDGVSFQKYAIRSYISTLVGQFVDNMAFALIVSLHLFGWTLTQCVVCSFFGCLVETIMEMIFSPLGFVIVKKLKSSRNLKVEV